MSNLVVTHGVYFSGPKKLVQTLSLLRIDPTRDHTTTSFDNELYSLYILKLTNYQNELCVLRTEGIKPMLFIF